MTHLPTHQSSQNQNTNIKQEDSDAEDEDQDQDQDEESAAIGPVTYIQLPDNNDLVEDGHAATIGVVDFPLLEPGEAHLTGMKSTPTEPFSTTGRKVRVPEKKTHYDSRGVVEVMVFAYTTRDTNMNRSSLSQYENFNHKRDLKPNAPSGKPAYVKPYGRKYFLCYGGQIALRGSKVSTHKWKNPELWTVQNDVRKVGLSPIMLIGNVDVPDLGMGRPMYDLPKELFDEFNKQPKKSESLKLNTNANGVRKSKREAPSEDEESSPPRKQKRKAKKATVTTSETKNGHVSKKLKLDVVEDGGDRYRDSFNFSGMFDDDGMEQGDGSQDGDMY
jgi:hypothetical protein